MPKSFNRSKQDHTGSGWKASGSHYGNLADADYVDDIDTIQASVGKKLDALLQTFA